MMYHATGSWAGDDMWCPSWQANKRYSKLFQPYSRAEVDCTRPDGRPQPELWDISNGCILWLPARDEVVDKISPESELFGKSPGFFDHPVIVLNVDVSSPRAAVLTFATITSFKNGTLQQSYPNDASVWNSYLLIAPGAPHPVSNALLQLENPNPKRGVRKNSYIALSEFLSLDFTAFRCYARGQKADGCRQRLNKESFDCLLREMNFVSNPWVETDRLWETFERYLDAAATGPDLSAAGTTQGTDTRITTRV